MGPDPGLALANIINSQHSMLQRQFMQGIDFRPDGLNFMSSKLNSGFGVGGPGWSFNNRMQRPFGIQPYAPPFSYYSPPPSDSTLNVPISTAGPGAGSSVSGSDAGSGSAAGSGSGSAPAG